MQLKTLKQISLEQIVEQEFLLTILLGFEGEAYEAYTILDIELEHLISLGHNLIDLLMANLDPEAEFTLLIPKNIKGELYTYLLNLRQKLPGQVYFNNEQY